MTTTTLTAEPATPSILYGARQVAGRNFRIYRRHWLLFGFGVLEPLLYLITIGVGVGNMIDNRLALDVGYHEFLAPALLATAAMNGAVNATAHTVFSRLRFENTYRVMLVTPLTSRDITLGEVAWAVTRAVVEATGFLAVVVLLGLLPLPRAAWGVVAALVIGFAFAAVGLLMATFLRDWSDFQAIQLVMLPMFLFATTFYPLDVYPEVARPLVVSLPLYHAIVLARAPMLTGFDPEVLLSVAYLVGLALLALLLGGRRLRDQLTE